MQVGSSCGGWFTWKKTHISLTQWVRQDIPGNKKPDVKDTAKCWNCIKIYTEPTCLAVYSCEAPQDMEFVSISVSLFCSNRLTSPNRQSSQSFLPAFPSISHRNVDGFWTSQSFFMHGRLPRLFTCNIKVALCTCGAILSLTTCWTLSENQACQYNIEQK